MPKKSFQDVVPPNQDGAERRTIRNIPVMRRGVRQEPVPTREPEPETPKFSPRESEVDLEKYIPESKRKFPSSKVFVGLAGLVILFFVFLMMNAFSSATVEITPKREAVSFNLNFNAVDRATTATTSTISNLKYEIIALSAEQETSVPSNGEENVEKKASVKIIVYNNFSATPQRLIARTRFETPEGLIFRIADSITVPGQIVNAKGKIPGSIEVTVYADEPGSKYNIGLSDFTIPGFKSEPDRFRGFYGRSSTKATGGLIGKAKKILEADKQKALLEMQTALMADMEKELASKLDPNMVVLKGGVLYDFTDLGQSDTGEGSNASIKESGTGIAISFSKKELTLLLENQVLRSWLDLPSEIKSFDEMSMVLEDPSWKPTKSSSFKGSVMGSTTVEASINTASIIDQIVGKDKSELMNLVNNSKSIESAKTSLRPLWENSFPENASKIKVEINEQE